MSSLLVRDSIFFDRSLESPDVEETVTEAETTLDRVELEGVHECAVTTPTGEFHGVYLVEEWNGNDASTLFFHHGSGEDLFDFGRLSSNSARRLFTADQREQ